MEQMGKVLATVTDEKTADRATSKFRTLALEVRKVMEQLESQLKKKEVTLEELEVLKEQTTSDTARSKVSCYVDELMRVKELLRGRDHPLVAEIDKLRKWMTDRSRNRRRGRR